MKCYAEYDSSTPSDWRELLNRAQYDDNALREVKQTFLAKGGVVANATLGTTQSMNLIGGGVKTNTLPTSAWVTINHRIAWDRYVHFISKQ